MSFDDDRKLGESAEAKLSHLLTEVGFKVTPFGDGHQPGADLVVNGVKVEIKRDILTEQTGNFAFEYMYKGKPSGVSTGAEVFCVMADKFYCFRTRELQDWLRANWKYLKHTTGGDGFQSRLVLARKGDVVTIAKWVIGLDGEGAKTFLCV